MVSQRELILARSRRQLPLERQRRAGFERGIEQQRRAIAEEPLRVRQEIRTEIQDYLNMLEKSKISLNQEFSSTSSPDKQKDIGRALRKTNKYIRETSGALERINKNTNIDPDVIKADWRASIGQVYEFEKQKQFRRERQQILKRDLAQAEKNRNLLTPQDRLARAKLAENLSKAPREIYQNLNYITQLARLNQAQRAQELSTLPQGIAYNIQNFIRENNKSLLQRAEEKLIQKVGEVETTRYREIPTTTIGRLPPTPYLEKVRTTGKLAILDFARGVVGGANAIVTLPITSRDYLRKVINDPSLLGKIPEQLKSGIKTAIDRAGYQLRVTPDRAIAQVGTEYFITKGTGKTFKILGKVTPNAVRRIAGRFKPEVYIVGKDFPRQARSITTQELRKAIKAGKKLTVASGAGTKSGASFLGRPKYAGTEGTRGRFITPGIKPFKGIQPTITGEMFTYPQRNPKFITNVLKKKLKDIKTVLKTDMGKRTGRIRLINRQLAEQLDITRRLLRQSQKMNKNSRAFINISNRVINNVNRMAGAINKQRKFGIKILTRPEIVVGKYKGLIPKVSLEFKRLIAKKKAGIKLNQRQRKQLREFYQKVEQEATRRGQPLITLPPKTLRQSPQPELEYFNIFPKKNPFKQIRRVNVGKNPQGVKKILEIRGNTLKTLAKETIASYKAQLIRKDLDAYVVAELAKAKTRDILKGRARADIIDNSGRNHIKRIKEIGRQLEKKYKTGVKSKIIDAFAIVHDAYKQRLKDVNVAKAIAHGLKKGYYNYIPAVRKLNKLDKAKIARMITLDEKPPVNFGNLNKRLDDTIKYSPYKLSQQEKLIINADRLARFGNKADPDMIFDLSQRSPLIARKRTKRLRLKRQLKTKRLSNILKDIKNAGTVKAKALNQFKKEIELGRKGYYPDNKKFKPGYALAGYAIRKYPKLQIKRYGKITPSKYQIIVNQYRFTPYKQIPSQYRNIVTKYRFTPYKQVPSRYPIVPRIPRYPIPGRYPSQFPIRPRPIPKSPRLGKEEKRLKKQKKGESKQGYNVFVKSKGKLLRLNSMPLSERDAKNRGAYAIDNSTSRTFIIKKNPRLVSRLGSIKKKEQSYLFRKKPKFRIYRIRRGKKIIFNKRRIIEKRKFGIDTRGEKRGLSIARLARREGFIKRNQYNIRVARPRKSTRRSRGKIRKKSKSDDVFRLF